MGKHLDGQEAVIAFNRENRIGAFVQYWPGAREGRGKFGTTRGPAELQAAGIPVVWIAGQAGYVALSHVDPVPHQPDGIDEHNDTGTLPDAAKAAERVGAYVSAFGDGLYDVVDGEPLYGRDLEALTRAARQLDVARELLSTVKAITETWSADPGAYPDGAADPLEQIATILLGPRSTRKR